MTVPSLMIFAAGFGSRMGALTKSLPKPMLPLGDAPMIQSAIDLGRSAGVNHIVANTHYLSEKIAPYLQAQDVIVQNETPNILDTGGGLKASRQHLTSPTFTLNPDVLWEGTNPLDVLRRAWRETDGVLLLLVPLERTRNRRPPGDFSVEGDRISRGGNLVYTGAQMMRLELLDAFEDSAFSLNEVWDRAAQHGALRGVVYPGVWHDIGTPAGLAAANQQIGAIDV